MEELGAKVAKSGINCRTREPNIYPATVVRTPEHGLEEGLKVMWGREWAMTW